MPALAERDSSQARQGLPGHRISGGSRGEGLAGAQPVAALSPSNNLSLTASDRPSLYFIVSTFNQSYPTEFSLRDSEGNVVYNKTVEIEKDQEIVSIQLPEKSLQAEQNYRWYFSVVCDAYERSQNIVLTGWLGQISPDAVAEPLTQSIASFDSPTNRDNSNRDNSSVEAGIERVKAYQNSELWSDAVSALVELRQRYPNDYSVRAEWSYLLRSLGLENIIEPSIAIR